MDPCILHGDQKHMGPERCRYQFSNDVGRGSTLWFPMSRFWVGMAGGQLVGPEDQGGAGTYGDVERAERQATSFL